MTEQVIEPGVELDLGKDVRLVVSDCRGPISGMNAHSKLAALVYADPPYGASDRAATHWPEKHYTTIDAAWDKGGAVPSPDSWVPLAAIALRPGGSMCVSCSFHNEAAVGLAAAMTLDCPWCGVVECPRMIELDTVLPFLKGWSLDWRALRKAALVTGLRDHGRYGRLTKCCACGRNRRPAFTFKNKVIWNRTNAIPLKRAKQSRMWSCTHELVFYFRRTGAAGAFNYDWLKACNGGKIARDVWSFPWNGGKRGFKGQKPDEMMDRIVGALTMPGDLVLDPFVGTGSTAAAVVRAGEGRRYVGWELNVDHAGLAAGRIREELARPRQGKLEGRE